MQANTPEAQDLQHVIGIGWSQLHNRVVITSTADATHLHAGKGTLPETYVIKLCGPIRGVMGPRLAGHLSPEHRTGCTKAGHPWSLLLSRVTFLIDASSDGAVSWGWLPDGLAA